MSVTTLRRKPAPLSVHGAWQETCKTEATDWHKAKGIDDPQRLQDFGAGFDQGWRQCLAALRMHQII